MTGQKPILRLLTILQTTNHLISRCCELVHIFPLRLSLYMDIKVKRCFYRRMSQNLRQGFCIKALLNPAAGELMAEGMYFYMGYLAFFQKRRVSSLNRTGFHAVLRSCQEKTTAIFLQSRSERKQTVRKGDFTDGGGCFRCADIKASPGGYPFSL